MVIIVYDSKHSVYHSCKLKYPRYYLNKQTSTIIKPELLPEKRTDITWIHLQLVTAQHETFYDK